MDRHILRIGISWAGLLLFFAIRRCNELGLHSKGAATAELSAIFSSSERLSVAKGTTAALALTIFIMSILDFTPKSVKC